MALVRVCLAVVLIVLGDASIAAAAPTATDPGTAGTACVAGSAGNIYSADLWGNITRCNGSTWVALTGPSATTAGVGATTFASLTDVSVSVAGNNMFAVNTLPPANSGVAYSTAFGLLALSSASNTGNANTAFGQTALGANTTGSYNTGIGQGALKSNTTGNYNTGIGQSALQNNTTGGANSALGLDAGWTIADGSTANKTTNNSLFLGAYTKANADGDTNEIAIGYNTTGLGNNTVTLGNSSIVTTALRGNVGIGTTNPTARLDVSGGIVAHAPPGGQAYVASGDGTVASNFVWAPLVLDSTGAPNYMAGIYVTKSGLGLAISSTLATALYIDSTSKNVGIGTSTPGSPLTLQSTVNNLIPTFQISSPGSAGWGGTLGLTNTYSGIPTPNKYLRVNQNGYLTIVNSAQNAEIFTITDTGNIGIGTSVPYGQLHTYSTSTTGVVDFGGVGDGAWYQYVALDNGAPPYSSSARQWILSQQVGNNSFHIRYWGGANPYSDNNLTIMPNGNVGIGVGVPAYPLVVSAASDGSHTLNVRGDPGTFSLPTTLLGPILQGVNTAQNVQLPLTLVGSPLLLNPNSGSSGYVGIGTTNPTAPLFVQTNIVDKIPVMEIASPGSSGGSWGATLGFYNTASGVPNPGKSIRVANNGNLQIINSAANAVIVDLTDTGNMSLLGTLTQNSDRRLKTNITPLPDVLNKIDLITGVSYNWKDPKRDPRQQVGVIAQDVQKAYPQLVTADASGTLSVNYSGLVAPLIEATKQLKAKSDADDAKIARLKDADNAKIARLENEVGILVREVEAERARVGIIDQLAGTTALHVVWTKQEKQDLVNRATRYYPSPVKEFADLVNEVSATRPH